MICCFCQADKDTDLFMTTGPRRPKCKKCHSTYVNNYLKLNPDKAAANRKYASKSRAKRKATLRLFVNWLKEAPCFDCKGCFHPEVMEFDHVDVKNFGISVMVSRTTTDERLMEEILKCELVCANCHRLRTVMRRVK